MKFLTFDLEISTPIPDGATDWRPFRPSTKEYNVYQKLD